MITDNPTPGRLGAHHESPRLSAHEEAKQLAAYDETEAAAGAAVENDPIFENSRKGNVSGAMKWGLGLMLALAVVTAVAVAIGLSHHKSEIDRSASAYATPGAEFVLYGRGHTPSSGFRLSPLTSDGRVTSSNAQDKASSGNGTTATAISPDGRATLIAIADPSTRLVYLFDVDASTISENATLNEFAKRVADSGKEVMVVAYTDPSGSPAHNDRLSQRRANALGQYLATHGVDASLIRTAGKGSTDAFGSASLDRRAELHIN